MALMLAGWVELRCARVGDHVETHAFLDGQALALPGATLDALADLVAGRALDREATELLVRAGVLVPPGEAAAPSPAAPAGRMRLRPELTLFCDQPAQRGVIATGSAPLSMFVAPPLLGAMQHVVAALRGAWQQLWRAAIARDARVPPEDAIAILGAIARAEHEREPALSRAFAVEEPFRLVPRVPLQGDAVTFPIAGLAFAPDRASPPAVHSALLDGGVTHHLARAGELLGALAGGLDRSALDSRLAAVPELRGLVEAIAQVGGLGDDQLARPITCAPGEIVHLGHATLLANLGGAHVLVDPWLPAASRGDADRAPTPIDLPRLAAIAITHHHWDHVHAETLLLLDKRVPVLVPAQPSAAMPVPRTERLLRHLGFTDVRALGHGERAAIGDGGAIIAAPFTGEDPCELGWVGNTYVLEHRGRAAYVHVDASPDRHGRSTVSAGAVRALREAHGALSPVFATRRQERASMLDYGWEALFAPASAWVEPTENCATGAAFLASLVRDAGARDLVIYSEGGAPWYPEHTNFLNVPGREASAAPYQYLWEPLDEIERAVAAEGASLAAAAPYRRFRIGVE